MHKRLFAWIKPLLKPLLVSFLVITLVLGQADSALAARSGGRIGGGSFRVPTRTAPAPRTYAPPGGGGYYPGGGGFGFPFIVPIFGFGGGGLFTLLLFMALASFIVRSFRAASSSDEYGYTTTSPKVSVAKLQVGLLAQARELQTDLNRIAQRADTSSSEGLAQVLQETTLSLLRHPEYWIYGGSESQQARLESAEAQFNRLTLAERSKFSEETLSNVNNLLQEAEKRKALAASGELAMPENPSEYIVVTLLVATQGKLELPDVKDSQDLRKAISQLGAVSSDRLLAMEVLWTPQAEGDTLSAEDVLVGYPELRLV
ncbi:DUF1517 domain-containing protein [Egbenema bharatensis]|uniref:DUF1517 domain-containing protein n=1 Tax=Egbenema bharatensis TaxID=3463334 RepID=UPI003A84BF22